MGVKPKERSLPPPRRALPAKVLIVWPGIVSILECRRDAAARSLAERRGAPSRGQQNITRLSIQTSRPTSPNRESDPRLARFCQTSCQTFFPSLFLSPSLTHSLSLTLSCSLAVSLSSPLLSLAPSVHLLRPFIWAHF